jgi:hypothetical protein
MTRSSVEAYALGRDLALELGAPLRKPKEHQIPAVSAAAVAGVEPSTLGGLSTEAGVDMAVTGAEARLSSDASVTAESFPARPLCRRCQRRPAARRSLCPHCEDFPADLAADAGYDEDSDR